MKIEFTYSQWDLEIGICKCCGEESNEIVKSNGRCVDCINDIAIMESEMNKYG